MVAYGAAKFLAYSAWCYGGLIAARAVRPGVGRSFGFGAVRWFIGLFFGVAIFFAVGSIDAEATFRTYLLIYTPVRLVEWGIMAVLIARRVQAGAAAHAILPLSIWCAGGILVSFLTDVVSPEGLQGRFCVGRCLC